MAEVKKVKKLSVIEVIRLIENMVIKKVEERFKKKKALDIDIHKKINLVSYILYYDLEIQGLKAKAILKDVQNDNHWKDIKTLLKKELHELKLELLGRARAHRKLYFTKVAKTKK